MMERSANQVWRDSGTTLSFKDWITREKKKFMNFNGTTDTIVNKPLNDTVQTALSGIRKNFGFQDKESGKTIFGLNKTAVIVFGIVAVVGLVWYFKKK